jgi:hypothetical protein
MTIRIAAVLLAALTLPRAAAGQDSLRLAFAPVLGAKVHRLFQTHTRITIVGVDTAGAPVARTRDVADLGGMTQVALAGPEGALVLHLAFDSLRARARDGGQPWSEFEVEGADTLWVQAEMNERMQVLEIRGGGDPGSGLLVHLLTGVPGLTLPGRSVAAGDEWGVRLQFPLDEFLGRSPMSTPSVPLTARATFTVDSIAARAKDTLAFVGFRGAFTPRDVTDEEGARLRYDGVLEGTLVWSTGWGSLVSAVTRTRLQLDAAAQDAVAARRRVTFETTVRQSVSP